MKKILKKLSNKLDKIEGIMNKEEDSTLLITMVDEECSTHVSGVLVNVSASIAQGMIDSSDFDFAVKTAVAMKKQYDTGCANVKKLLCLSKIARSLFPLFIF